MIAGLMALVQVHRSEIYRLDGLRGEVDGHWGDRIRSKLDIVLRDLAKAHNVDPAIVEGSSPRKRKNEDGSGEGKGKSKGVKAEKKISVLSGLIAGSGRDPILCILCAAV